MRNEMTTIKVCLVKYLLPEPFDVQYIDVFEKPMRLRFFDLKKIFITSDKTLIKKLWRIVVYNVVKLKVEIILTFFLGIYLNQLCKNWECIFYNPKHFKACVK